MATAKTQLKGLKGQPIYDDFGRIVGFEGGPYFPEDPIDLTEQQLGQATAGLGNARMPVVLPKSRAAQNKTLFVPSQTGSRSLTPEEMQKGDQKNQRQEAFMKYLGAKPLPPQGSSNMTEAQFPTEAGVKPIKRSYTKQYAPAEEQPGRGGANYQQTSFNRQETPQYSGGEASAGWDEFVTTAKQVASETGFPLQVILGQAAVETGRDVSNAPGNNWFGIKGAGSAGTQNLNTQEATDTGEFYNTSSNFAKFNSPQDAIYSYVNLIKNKYPDAYAKKDNPQAMIQAIHRGGYATDPNYAAKVIGTPEFRQGQAYQPVSTPAQPIYKPAASPTNYEDDILKRYRAGQITQEQANKMINSTPVPTPAASPKPTPKPINFFQGVKNLVGGLGKKLFG